MILPKLDLTLSIETQLMVEQQKRQIENADPKALREICKSLVTQNATLMTAVRSLMKPDSSNP